MRRARWLWVLGVGMAGCSPRPAPVDASAVQDMGIGETTPAMDVLDVSDVSDPPDATTVDVHEASAPDVGQGIDATDDVLMSLDVEPGDTEADASTWPVCLGADLAVGADADEARLPSLVWNGSEYGVAWQQSVGGNLDIHFARIAADGTVLEDARVSDDGGSNVTPSMAWNGHDYAVVWSRTTAEAMSASIRIAMISVDGHSGLIAVSTTQSVTDVPLDAAAGPSILAIPPRDGGGFAVTWEDSRNGTDNHEIYFATLDQGGSIVGPNVRVTNAPRLSYSPVLQWNERRREIGLVWIDDRNNHAITPNEEIYFARLAPTGMRPTGSDDVRLTDDSYRSLWPSFTYDASGFALVWANESDVPDRPHILFSQRTDDGDARADGADGFAVSSNPPDVGAWTNAIGWNGAEYLVVWEDARHLNGDLVVRRFEPGGAPLTREIFLGDDRVFSAHPSLVWSGTEWAVSWEDDRSDHRDVFFRRIARDACVM